MYFKDIKCVKIDELITNKHEFYAHLKGDNNNDSEIVKETLKEHTSLCLNYFFKIVSEKNLTSAFENFENLYLKDISEKGKKLFREFILNVISFHDIGKINPIFQNRKMKNCIAENIEIFSCIESKHSIISSVIYFDYYVKSVRNLPRKDIELLLPLLMFNSYLISRHHSGLEDFDSFFLEEFDDGKSIFKVIDIFSATYKDILCNDFSLNKKIAEKYCKIVKKLYKPNIDSESAIYIYTFERLLYSLLVACDFYATGEFMNNTVVDSFGSVDNISEFYDTYRNTFVYKSIQKYREDVYSKNDKKNLIHEKNINILRNEMFLDSEEELLKNINECIFFLEAPTGSGKSNVSMNLSFKLIERNPLLKKIYYVYPFNTLIEQNLRTINKIFKEDKNVLNKVAVVNSLFPIKMDEKYKDKLNEGDYDYNYYAKSLLDRQFLNYPMILTTHVSLFNTMFGCNKEDTFGFYQLTNSVIVLDEIQSYKNTIWSEIIMFLKCFAKILNIKIIIMSATLPNLNALSLSKDAVCHLIKDREKYFSNPLFKDRVKINYELMKSENVIDDLYHSVLTNAKDNKKILIEFIKKQSAYDFYNKIVDNGYRTELMTGDDNLAERARIIKEISFCEQENKGIILVATQVIEAGVDIDMDIGYKDISKLDSDEQLMGRINRSCKKDGIVYFFDLDKTDKIYKNDFRVNTNLSLRNDEMKNILKSKEFAKYYSKVLKLIKEQNTSFNDSNLIEFFEKKVGMLNFYEIMNRMKLIDDDNYNMSIFLARQITFETENTEITLDGETIWKEYKQLLTSKMDYAEKEVKLSEIRSKMNYFIYQITKNDDLVYNDKIGDLYYLENGDNYFKDNKLDKEKFKKEVGLFVSFI